VAEQRNNKLGDAAESVHRQTIGVFTRRLFLKNGIAAAGSFFALSGINPLLAKSLTPQLDLRDLTSKFKFKGTVLSPADPNFNKVAFGGLWNKLQPSRKPQVIASVSDEQDVVAAVKFARANKLKVSVRGGGHNWCAPSLRNKGMLIDLTNLNKVISIDTTARKAIVQPIISNREIQAYLNSHGLSYPSGHCPPVKLSGYLLSGGMAWNQGVWGHGCHSVDAVELVTPEGELITANADQNQDYFWAARGAGPGLFAVATRYHLKLYPLPKAIVASTYYYPYENLVDVAEWLGPLAKDLSNKIELSIFILSAPPHLSEKCKSSTGKVCLVTATMFADTQEEADKALKALDSCPVMGKCLEKSVAQPTDFERLFDASGALWPANLRNSVDALFSNASAKDLVKPMQEHFLKVPSPKSIVMFALFTGKEVPAPLPDAAFSMTAKIYGGPWTMWDDAADDQANKLWHDKCVQLLMPHISGHYVSESDTVGHPAYAKASYKEANWNRLAELRKKYDPDGVFFGFSDGLS
jgi:FAD/FMN-containing dehydrogenase